MPVYVVGTNALAQPGYPHALWNAEVIAAGGKSAAISIRRDGSFPACLAIELQFAANPGAFSIDLQAADTDADTNYVTRSTYTTGLNASFVGRIEVTNLVAKYVRLVMVSITNAVAVTAKIS